MDSPRHPTSVRRSPRTSLFGRIARHGITGLRNAREDRLTEITAAILDHPACHGLARHVALGWLDEAHDQLSGAHTTEHAEALIGLLAETHDWVCTVRTQIGFETDSGHRRPDLELRFRSDRHEVVLWAEVKHGSAPHTHQLQAYADEQAHRGLRHATVLLLAPRADYRTFPADQIPSAVPRLSWEHTARVIQHFRASDPVAEFMIAELLHYLREEGLMDPSHLSGDHIRALAAHHDAAQALHRLCELAAGRVAELGHGPANPDRWPQHAPREFWWTYPDVLGPRSTARAQLDWTWQLLLDSTDVLLDGGPGIPCLFAGVTAPPGTIRTLEPKTRTILRRADFELLATGDSNSSEWEYIVQVRFPETWPTLLTGDDLEAQAQSLAQWIDAAFRDAAAALSPSTARR